MKVLHFCSSIGKHSGVMKVITEYHKYLNKNYGITFDYLYWCEDIVDYSQEITQMGGQLIKIEKPSIKTYKDFMQKINELSKIYDIIHIHELYLVRFIYKIFKKNNCTIIGHAHTTEFSDTFLGKWRNKVLCKNINKKTDILIGSSSEAGLLYFSEEFYISGVVLPNILQISDYKFNKEIRSKYRKKIGLKSKDVWLHVGRFNEQKNHKKVIDVFKAYIEVFDNANLVLIGEGPLKEKYKSYVEELGIEDKVMFMGTRNDINKIMIASDIFLFPSLFEGLGISLVEAQYTGLTCICSDKIPKEAYIRNDLLTISLNESDEKWAELIYLKRQEDQINERNEVSIISDIFDSNKSGDLLLDIYKGVFYE